MIVGMDSVSTNPSLLEALRGGADERAWERFVECYERMLVSFAKRLSLTDSDACDAAQETLTAVFTHFRSLPEPFDRSKGRFRSWLHGVAKHKVLDIKKAKFKHAHAQLSVHEGAIGQSAHEQFVEEHGDPIDKAFDQEWRLNQVARALEVVKQETDPSVYQAFFLTFVEMQKPAKVAEFLGVSKNAVYVSKSKTLKRVKKIAARIASEEE